MLGGGSYNRDVAGIRDEGEPLSKRIAAAQDAGIDVFVQMRNRHLQFCAHILHLLDTCAHSALMLRLSVGVSAENMLETSQVKDPPPRGSSRHCSGLRGIGQRSLKLSTLILSSKRGKRGEGGS